jgi:hypothetical protein
MTIKEFSNWAQGNGIINPLVKDEIEMVGNELKSMKQRKTGKKSYVFVSPVGVVVNLLCNKDGEIVDVAGNATIDEWPILM